MGFARLACVKHAASVRPEPGSNSPLMSIDNPARPPKRTSSVHRHIKEYGSGEPYSPGAFSDKQTSCSSVIANLTGLRVAEAIPNRDFGTDFWHAVEFSRDGC